MQTPFAINPSNQPVPLIIDTDNAMGMPVADVDDGVALAAAVGSSLADIVAVCACPGNCSAAASASNSRILLNVLGRADVLVGLGPERAMLRDRDGHHAFLAAHAREKGRVYWEERGLHPRVAEEWVFSTEESLPDAPSVIVQAALAGDGNLVVLCLGSLTNLALALDRAPEIAGRIGRIVHMGGAFLPWEDGHMAAGFSTPDIPGHVWETTLRFNTWYDPEASAVVFSSGIPVVVVPVNVTSQAFLRRVDVETLRNSGEARQMWLARRLDPWVEWSAVVRGLPGAHMHDPMALAALLAPGLFDFQEMHVDGGALLREAPVWLQRSGTGPRVRVAVRVDVAGFERWLLQQLARL